MLKTDCRTLSKPIIVDQRYCQIARLRSIETIQFNSIQSNIAAILGKHVFKNPSFGRNNSFKSLKATRNCLMSARPFGTN